MHVSQRVSRQRVVIVVASATGTGMNVLLGVDVRRVAVFACDGDLRQAEDDGLRMLFH